MGLKKTNWVSELRKSGSIFGVRCQHCSKYHAQNCTVQQDTDNRTGSTEDPLQLKQAGSERISIRNPPSWLPASSRHPRHVVGDVEETAKSPSCLITPFTDEGDDDLQTGSAREEEIPNTQGRTLSTEKIRKP